MGWVGVVIFSVTLVCAVKGLDITFDVGESILRLSNTPTSTTPTVAVSQAAPGNDRKSCKNSAGDIFYTSGSDVLQSGNPNPIATLASGSVIQSLTCCCDMIIISYQTTTTTGPAPGIHLWIYVLPSSISLHLWFPNLTTRGALKCYIDDQVIILLTRSRLVLIPFNGLTTSVQLSLAGNLIALPVCVACCTNSANPNGFDLYVSYQSNQFISRLIYDGSAANVIWTTSTIYQTVNRRVHCVDGDGGDIYALTTPVNNTNWVIRSFTKAELDGVPNVVTGTVLFTGTTTVPIPNNVNGLNVCGATCSSAICGTTCGCTSPCGFCLPNDATCYCANSLSTPLCTYANAADATTCAVRIPPIDACCLVRNPLAVRRSGPAVSVVGISGVNAAITIGRKARTGRWIILPPSTAIVDTVVASPFYAGIAADVQTSARGKRYGLFVANINPTGQGLPESIPCIATENSGFVNAFYTVTVNSGEMASLTATMTAPLLVFQPNVRWYYTAFNAAWVPINPQAMLGICAGQLSCNVTGEGLYQVARPRRQLRTWHPIFFVYVRGCAAGFYNPPACSPACVTCGNGICDELTGLCNCFPGYMGGSCNAACSANTFGQNCNLMCSDVFGAGVTCSGVLICNPRKVGCRCLPPYSPPGCL